MIARGSGTREVAVAGVLAALLALVPPATRADSTGAAPATATPSSPAAADTGVARGGVIPKGQPPVALLTIERFRNAFDAEAGQPRLVLLLSPT